MSNSIDHLDFYPEDPEAISALHEMSSMDRVAKMEHYNKTRRRRTKTVIAAMATTMALSAGGIGYVVNRDAQKTYHSTPMEIAVTAWATLAGLSIGGFISRSGFNALNRRYPLEQPTE